jgi:gas vesicle protein
MKALGYFAAIVGGAVAGATAALLLAPEKGENTRAKIQEAVKDFCDKHNIDLTFKQVKELAKEVEGAE